MSMIENGKAIDKKQAMGDSQMKKAGFKCLGHPLTKMKKTSSPFCMHF